MAVHHPIFARLYPRMGKAMDLGGMARHRRALLAGLAGEVTEVGARDGLNFGVVAPGGQLRFLEHVRADTSGFARVQRFLDATVWPRLAGGCHTGRDTTAAIERSGFAIKRLDRFRFPDAGTPSSLHILGTALRRD